MLTDKEKSKLLVALCLSQTFQMALYLNISSFYPLYVSGTFPQDYNTTMIAIAISAFDLAGVVFSPLHIGLIGKLGRKNALLIANILLALTNGCLGALSYFNNDQWIEFFVASVVVRIVQGYADSLAMTAVFAIVASVFHEDKAKYIGICEAVGGLGLMAGPPIGSIIYSFKGFSFTFYFFGLTNLLAALLVLFLVPRSVNQEDSSQDPSLSKSLVP